MERKLAAILAADVAGYSRLTARDEEATLRTLGEYREAVAGFVTEHGGRIFGSAGDSFVAEFPSAVQSVRCAVAIQRGLFRRNRDLNPTDRIEFRIGINLGDVVVDGTNLMGDGVNVAARVQEIAVPNGICIAESVRAHLDGKIAFRLDPMGERTFKNIPKPVAVFTVAWQAEDPQASGVLGDRLTLPDKPSIAVLPFQNLSGDPEQEFFADGVCEDIITELSRHRWFFVIARNSSFVYKGLRVDVKQVARELGVRYVVEGSVRKSDSRIRITAQLIEAATGAHLWAERYDRDIADVFDIQDEITAAVSGAIEPELYLVEGRRAAMRGDVNLDAYQCCLRGMWHHYQMTSAESVLAMTWLQRSIELDSAFARSHMAMARVRYGRCLFGWSTDVASDIAGMSEHADRAVMLDGRDCYSHYAIFASRLLQGQLAPALAAAQRMIDLNVNFALGHLALGWVRIFMGHPQEAMDPLLRAMRLSPRDPISVLFLSNVALAQFHLGNFAEAAHFADRATAARPYIGALAVKAAAFGLSGDLGDPAPVVRELQRVAPGDPAGYWRAVYPYARTEDRTQFFGGLAAAGLILPL